MSGRRALLSATVVALSLSADGSASTQQVVIPAGEFSAPDGRPGNVPGSKTKVWRNGPDQFTATLDMAQKLGRPICVDYEHALIKKRPLGEKAIASGWIKSAALSYDPARGTVATIDWTDTAAEHIRKKELAYLSPVFLYDDEGNVLGLHSVALTNDPALSQLAVAALSAEFNGGTELDPDNSTGDNPVNLAVAICAALGIAATATEDQVVAHVADLAKLAKAEPDPTKFVAMATLTAEQVAHADTRNKLAALSAQVTTATLDGYIKDATDAGAVLTAEFAADVRVIADKMGLDVAKRQLDALPRAAALANQSQTQGKPPVAGKDGKDDKANVVALTDSQKSMATLLGCSEEAYAAELVRQRALGMTV